MYDLQAGIAKAIFEVLTFELRVNMDLLRDSGIKISELRAVGGGARSDVWLRIKADICKTALRVPKVTEAACLGASILASVATGAYPDLSSAVEHAVHLKQRIEPVPERSVAYETRYQLYKKLYPQLIPLHHELVT